MEVGKFIFQIDSKLVKNQYSTSENIRIIDKDDGDPECCVIYFSSNEIYYPNTESAFSSSILKKDKYEWQNNLFPNAGRHILVRDIQKQWYIAGSSSDLNSPTLLVEHLKKLTQDCTIYTIGSSAGGFAALLFGSLLGAKRVYAFNAQLDLNVVMDGSSENIDPILFRNQHKPTISKFYRIGNFLKQDIEYFYFQSAKSAMDIAQFNACSNKEMLTKIEFDTSNHGFPFLRHDLRYVLSFPPEELKKLSSKRMHPFIFSVKINGFFNASTLTLDAIKKRILKKITERKHAIK